MGRDGSTPTCGLATVLPEALRPEARVLSEESGAASDLEVLAVLVGGPRQYEKAAELVRRFGGIPGVAEAALRRDPELIRIAGQSAAARLCAAADLGVRMWRPKEDPPTIRCSADAAAVAMAEIGYREQEHLCVLLLDARRRVRAVRVLFRGSTAEVRVTCMEILREAVRHGCPAIIVAHNHPSGDVDPSPEDRMITRRIVEAGRLLDIEVLDHLIVGRGRYVSLRERGVI